jgi:ankyrin repeat protein
LPNVAYASLEVVQLLIGAGLKANEKNKFGETPLNLAKKRRDETQDRDLKNKYDTIVKYLEKTIASPSKSLNDLINVFDEKKNVSKDAFFFVTPTVQKI